MNDAVADKLLHPEICCHTLKLSQPIRKYAIGLLE